jgi:hypothetical protein
VSWFSTPKRDVLSPEQIQKIHNEVDLLYGPWGSNAELYQTTKAVIEAANFPDPTKFARRALMRFLERCENDLRIPNPRANICIQIAGAAAEFYALEGLTVLPPDPSGFSHLEGNATIGIVRDYLLLLQRKAANPQQTLETLYTTITESFVALTRALPPIAYEEAEGDPNLDDCMTIPLLDVIPNMGEIVNAVLEPFTFTDESGLFRRFRQRLADNLTKLGERSRRVPDPEDHDGSAQDIATAYLGTTPFERVLFQGVIPFTLPDATRFAGHWIIAPPGRGKTTLLHSMVRDDISNDDACVIIMDSKGDLTAPLRELKELEDRLIVIDPDPEHPIAINPLDIPKTDISLAVANLEYIFGSLLEVKMTPNQTVLFRSVLRALITAFPNPTFETFRDVIQNGIEKYREHIEKLPQDLQDFFFKEFNTKTYQDRRPEIIWRIRLLLENDAMRGMLLAAKTRFNIGEAMDTGKIVIINNSKALLGDRGAEFFGRFFIAQVLAAAQQRGSRRPDQKPPVYFYIDECQNVIARDERISTILDECRSQKVALILAHQRTDQIKSADVLSALSNCAIRYANSDDEAQYLAPRLRTTKAFLETLSVGKFAVFVRDMTSRAIAISVPQVDFSAYQRFSAAEREAFTQRMRSAYGTEAAHAPMSPERRKAAEALAEALAPVTEQVLTRLNLDEARKALEKAIATHDWARAGELQHSIIPEMERKLATQQPRPVASSADTPRPAPTGSGMARPAATDRQDAGRDQAAKDWQ